MAARADRLEDPAALPDEFGRVYTACFFDQGLVVPRVKVLEAPTDDDAISELRSLNRFTERELWHGHRLVAVIPPDGSPSRRS